MSWFLSFVIYLFLDVFIYVFRYVFRSLFLQVLLYYIIVRSIVLHLFLYCCSLSFLSSGMSFLVLFFSSGLFLYLCMSFVC